VFVSAIALLPLVWRGCEATTREQIYLLQLEPAANNTFSEQDAQILPYFVFTVFVHSFPKFRNTDNSCLRSMQRFKLTFA
jgi:hypothetical protein